MLKKTIRYTNFNDEEEVEDFWFNLTRSELVKLELSKQGGLEESIKAIIASNDGAAIMKQFNEILRLSYGKKSTDGKRFLKSDAMFEEFEATGAYDVLFMEIVTDPDAATAFIQGIMPKDLVQEAQLKMETGDEEKDQVELMQGKWIPPSEPREISRMEADAMDVAELQAGLASKTIVIHGDTGKQDPRILTTEDLQTMDVADVARGLSSGRYKLSE